MHRVNLTALCRFIKIIYAITKLWGYWDVYYVGVLKVVDPICRCH